MENDFKEAFYEVDEILKLMPKELLEKIPQGFKEMIRNNKSTTYSKDINGLENLDILKEETIVILSLIYRDFLCGKDERERLIEVERKKIEEQYSYDNLFKREKIKVEEKVNHNESTCLVEFKKERWYVKIIKFFKNN